PSPQRRILGHRHQGQPGHQAHRRTGKLRPDRAGCGHGQPARRHHRQGDPGPRQIIAGAERMPILLDPARAPALDALLASANTQGLDWRIEAAADATLPRIRGIGTLASAGPEEISFLTNPRYQSQLAGTRAAAVIVTPDAAQALANDSNAPACARVVCPHPYLLYARLAQWFDAA